MASAITGTPNLAASPTAYAAVGGGGSTTLDPAIQTIWSKEILFEAMPILRFEQFAVKKTELGVQPGLTINFMRYTNLDGNAALVEGVRMETVSLSANQFQITVGEHGKAIGASELLLNASFDDVLASASRLLGRHMAQYLDYTCRDVLLQGSSVVYGYDYGTLKAGARTPLSPYDQSAPAAGRVGLTGEFYFGPQVVKDAVETLSTKNVPRLGDTYVCFLNPHQSRTMRDWPEFIEVSKYAAPGNFMLGEIGRFHDTVFIETTQVQKVTGGAGVGYTSDTAGYPNPTGNGGAADRHTATFIGDNAFGHAISLPVELRDGGILDFGREHALAWYAIWGLGLVTDISIVNAETN